MTDHKFTDNELITLLNQCHDTESMVAFVIDSGNYRSEVVTLQRLIDLIKRQKCEIESLQAVHADMTESLRLAAEANKDMQAEIERLKKIGNDKTSEVLRHDAAIRELHKQLENAKSEAIKEFAERLKANMSNIARMEYGGNTYFCVGYDLIDSLVKEMTEVQNES